MLIFGMRWTVVVLGQLPHACTHCQKTTMHSAIVRRGKLTLFFLPIFPIGKKYLISCNLCGLRLQAVGDLLAQLEKSETAGHLVSA